MSEQNVEELVKELKDAISETADDLVTLSDEAGHGEHQEKAEAVKETLSRLHEDNQKENDKQAENKKRFLDHHFEMMRSVNEHMFHTAKHLGHHLEESHHDDERIEQLHELHRQIAEQAVRIKELEEKHQRQHDQHHAKKQESETNLLDDKPSKAPEEHLPHPHPGGFTSSDDD